MNAEVDSQQLAGLAGRMNALTTISSINMLLTNGLSVDLDPADPSDAVAAGEMKTAPEVVHAHTVGSAGTFVATPGLLQQGVSALSVYAGPGRKKLTILVAKVDPAGANVVKVAFLPAAETDVNADLVRKIIVDSAIGSSAELTYKDDNNVSQTVRLNGRIDIQMKATATFDLNLEQMP